MTPLLILRQTILAWPDWSMAIVEYNDGDVAVAVRRADNDVERRLVCKSVEEALVYAQGVIKFTRFINQIGDK